MILLLGGSGYVGHAYQALLSRKHVPFRNLRRAEVDYSNPAALGAVLRKSKAEFVINAAGYTGKPNVDACEIHKTDCLNGNAILPGRIAEACAAAGVPWGHVSSGCIYNGSHPEGRGFREDDPPNFSFRSPPCSFYSGTKALGEEILAGSTGSTGSPQAGSPQAGALDCYVWRLRIPFNEVDSPRNYLAKLMCYDRLLEAENSISQLEEFCAATLACWEKRVPFGTYNITNPGHVTTREVVDLIKRSGVCKKEFKFFASEEEFMQKAAKTPRANCVLDSTKLQSTGIRMTEVHEAVEQALRRWVPA